MFPLVIPGSLAIEPRWRQDLPDASQQTRAKASTIPAVRRVVTSGNPKGTQVILRIPAAAAARVSIARA